MMRRLNFFPTHAGPRRGRGVFVGVYAIASLCLYAPRPAAAQAPACRADTGKLALVLPGGGAKGFAHLGVLAMLDSLGIVPDLVVGTSAGAIFGALYASGLDVPDIERQVKGIGLDSLVGRYSAVTPPTLGNRRAILSWEGGAQGLILRTSVVREAPLNALVNALYIRGNMMAAGDFDRLPIPFRAVAADLATREQVVLGSGDLAQAVRASSAIPLVFRQVHLGGRDLVDGGIVNNVPVDVARALGASRVIVSALRDTSRFDVTDGDPLSISAQLLSFLFEQPLSPLRAGDVLLTSNVSGVNQLDFSTANVDRVIAAGVTAAASLPSAAACLPRGRVRPRGTLPPLAEFFVNGGADHDVARALWLTLGDIGGSTPDLPQLQRRLQSLAQIDHYRAVWLNPQRGAGDSVSFNVVARPASSEQLLAGAAFDHELGPRVWVGRVQRFAQRNAELTGVVSLGDLQQEVEVSMRRAYDVLRSPWSPIVGVDFTRAQVRDIRNGREYPVIQTADWLAEAGIERRFGRRASAALTAFARQWDEPVFASTPTAPGVRVRLQLLGAARQTPRGEVEFEGTMRYWRAAVELRRSRTRGGFTMESLLSAVVGEHLPLQSSAFLGGMNVGFPGFKIQELRGQQAATLAVQLSHPLVGPLNVQGLVAGGALQSATYGVFRQATGYFGARGGVGVNTALGPVALEYGVNDRARGNLWLRFGEWF